MRQWPPAIERFMAKVEILPNGCWRWMASCNTKGYGAFTVDGKQHPAHRWSVEHFRHTTIPKGLQCDHRCRNRWCVNPNHIELVTPLVNTQRGINPKRIRSHCVNGHPLTEDNLIWYLDKNWNRRYKQCRACRNANQNKHRKIKRQAMRDKP